MHTYTTNCTEIGLTLPDFADAQPILVAAQNDQLVHVYGTGLPRTIVKPGDSALFVVHRYPVLLAALRAMFNLPVYRWQQSV